MATEISVIIPSRNELKNLLWTLQALEAEFAGVNYEVVVVLNQCDPKEKARWDRTWQAQSGVFKVLTYDEKPSCWQARNLGAEMAEGEYLLFLDSHVLPAQGSFVAGMAYHRRFQGVLRFGVNYWLDNPRSTLYQYKWNPKKFWGTWTRNRPEGPDYRILMSGFAATMVDRSVFEEIRGLHPALGIYGGGEPYFDFKAQMFGYEIRCNPAFQIYHLTEKRGYAWNNDDLWRNFMIAAWAIGGHQALSPLYATYHKDCNGHEPYEIRLRELRDEAIGLAELDRQWIKDNAKKSFSDVLEMHDESIG